MMNDKQKRKRSGFWGSTLEILVECGELIFNILYWPFKILFRGIGAILEGIFD